ncbi:MAG: CPBP family intramembrane metalloprotease [Bacteroidia bacterium]|nr:CPBP family intramembrane metalloprotease [Bacteroidia bacterium]
MPQIIPFLKYVSPVRQLVALAIICLVSLSIISFISLLFAPLFGLGLNDLSLLSERLNEPQVLAYMKFSQVLSAIGLFILPPFLFMLFRGEKALPALRLEKPAAGILLFGAMALMLIQLPLINATAAFNSNMHLPASLEGLENLLRTMETSAAEVTEAFLQMHGLGDFLLMLFIVAVLPAFGEELLFRSTLQPLMIRLVRNPHLGIWITAFLFSFIHFQFFGFIPRFLIGGFLGYLFYFSKNSWFPVAAHFANNGIAVTASWLISTGYLSDSPDNLGIGVNAWWQCLLSLVLLIAGMYWFRKQSKGIA